jgi:hypothetical protein
VLEILNLYVSLLYVGIGVNNFMKVSTLAQYWTVEPVRGLVRLLDTAKFEKAMWQQGVESLIAGMYLHLHRLLY